MKKLSKNSMSKQKEIHFPILNVNGEKQEKNIILSLKIPEDYNVSEKNNKSNYLFYRAFQKEIINERQGTANTKTRAEVRGGGRKPWKQKGSGRARAGSNTSPLWKGGGVSFGPKPKTYTKKINRKEWRTSLRLLLIKKSHDILILDELSLESFKTKNLIKILVNLNQNITQKHLIIVPKMDPNLKLASQNLKTIQVLEAKRLNFKKLLLAKRVLITKESLKIIEETYND